MKKVTFITGNQDKADYLAQLLDMPINHKKLHLTEIQPHDIADPYGVVRAKVHEAYHAVQQPVLVEDVALHFDALDGLPGPFVKYFVEMDNGLETMCRMLDGLPTRNARATCSFGFYDGTEERYFYGELRGTIAQNPRGSNGFGWDKIFCPDGYEGKTRAELNEQEDRDTYMRIKPIGKLQEFLQGTTE